MENIAQFKLKQKEKNQQKLHLLLISVGQARHLPLTAERKGVNYGSDIRIGYIAYTVCQTLKTLFISLFVECVHCIA